MINYTKTTSNKKGTMVKGAVTYNVNVTTVNNEFARLNCSISKKAVKQYPDGNGGFVDKPEDTYVGNIAFNLENGRQIMEIIREENVIPHLAVFEEILNEVLGKSPTA